MLAKFKEFVYTTWWIWVIVAGFVIAEVFGVNP